MIEYILEIANLKNNDIILDFFSGSATTAHALLNVNLKNNINARFVMVQLPELCDEKSENFKRGFRTICDIGEERIRKVSYKMKEDILYTTFLFITRFVTILYYSVFLLYLYNILFILS